MYFLNSQFIIELERIDGVNENVRFTLPPEITKIPSNGISPRNKA